MNITTINAGSTKLFGANKNDTLRGSALPDGFSDNKKAGKFDTFTMSGTGADKSEAVKEAPDEKQAELIHRLSALDSEEQALAAIDAYHNLHREYGGRIRNLEGAIDSFNSMKKEYEFCKQSLENDGKAAYSGKFSFGTFEEGQNADKQVLETNMKQLERSMNIMVRSYNRNAAVNGQSELNARIVSSTDKRLSGYIEVYNAVTGGSGAGDMSAFEAGGCFDRYIDDVTVDNFVSKLSEKIGQLKSASENLTKSFNNYLDKNKTAENIFKRYPKIIGMRQEFIKMHDKFHGYEKEIKDNLGINDLLNEIKQLRKAAEESEDKKNDDDRKISFIGNGGKDE